MQPRTRIGLVVGVIGLVLNIWVSEFRGFYGPILALVAGGIAGLFAIQQAKPLTKQKGARVGATAGGIAGGLMILGQIIGGLGALADLPSSEATTPSGPIPDPSADPASQIAFYAGGVATAICFGVIGALLAAGAGAGVGYLGTSEQPRTPPTQNIMS